MLSGAKGRERPANVIDYRPTQQIFLIIKTENYPRQLTYMSFNPLLQFG